MSAPEIRLDEDARSLLIARLDEEAPEQVILVYAGPGSGTIEQRLGSSEYSYQFVLKDFLPVLEALGEVIRVEDPAEEVDALYNICFGRGIPCALLSFTPPHKTPLGLVCPTIPVFAWEFEDIPDEMTAGGADSDWTRPLGRLGWAITHSSFSAGAVRRAMRADFPVECIPAPVWDRFDRLRSESAGRDIAGPSTLSIPGPVLDSRTLDLSAFAPGPTGEFPHDPPSPPPERSAEARRDDVVYTCVYNPYDDRKNWFDVVGTFCLTMRDAEDATLILKLVHTDPAEGIRAVLRELYKCSPFRCRVLIQYGFLSPVEYEQLIRMTDYALNASRGEGQCLPLMEFMSSGRPAIAPAHTALADYVDASNAFLVETSTEPSVWPHDPRQVFRTLRHRINPESLAGALEESYRVAKAQPERYRSMANAAIERLGGHCSVPIAAGRLRRLLALRRSQTSAYGSPGASTARPVRLVERVSEITEPVRPEQPDFTAEPPPNGIAPTPDPRICGLEDAFQSGWFQHESGELFTGFKVATGDQVLDVGCGEGAAASFCARQGAQVIFVDHLREKVEGAMRLFPELADDRHRPLVCDAGTLPLPDAIATKVISIDVLEHLDDPAAALRELVRVGKPGAQYLISVPDATGEHVQKSLAPAGHFQTPNHSHIFERDEIRSLVLEAGLTVEQHRFTGFFWALAMCLYWAANADDEAFDGQPTRDLIRPPYADVVLRWTETWSALQALPTATEARTALDGLMPKNQIILARKPTTT